MRIVLVIALWMICFALQDYVFQIESDNMLIVYGSVFGSACGLILEPIIRK